MQGSPLDAIEVLPPGMIRLSDAMKALKLSRKQCYGLLAALGIAPIRVPAIRDLRLRLEDARTMERALAGEVSVPQAPRTPILRRSRSR